MEQPQKVSCEKFDFRFQITNAYIATAFIPLYHFTFLTNKIEMEVLFVGSNASDQNNLSVFAKKELQYYSKAEYNYLIILFLFFFLP